MRYMVSPSGEASDQTPRLPEVTFEDESPDRVAALRDELAASGGLLSNPARLYAYVPPVLKPLRELHGALEGSSTLEPQLVSLVRLLVAKMNGCPF
jgi:hypothetical protein